MKFSISKRIPSAVMNGCLQTLNKTMFSRMGNALLPSDKDKLLFPPVFIIGAPRSGSTLLMQILADAFDVGYMSNLHCLFFAAPALAELLFHPARNRQPFHYRSKHGKTQGWSSPAECGDYWYQFFRRKPAFVPLKEAVPAKMIQFRRSVAGLLKVFNKPLIFKNLYAALRIEPISYYIPESLFIVVYRDEIPNGHSLLEARLKVYGEYERWWSMEPPAIKKLVNLPPAHQVVEQIRHVYALIENAKKKIDQNRFMYIKYEKFCANVKVQVEKVAIFFEKHGVELTKKFDIPQSFPLHKGVRIPKPLYGQLVEYASPYPSIETYPQTSLKRD